MVYLQIAKVDIQRQQAEYQMLDALREGLEKLVNVFVVQQTPLDHYLKSYEVINKYIHRDLVHTIQQSDELHLRYFFFNIMSTQGKALIKKTAKRTDNYFGLGMAQLDEHDRLEFNTAQTKVKRELDQNLRTFKEFVDLEENKKEVQSHQSKLRH